MIKALEELTDDTARARIESGEAGRHAPLKLNLFSSSNVILIVAGVLLFLISPVFTLLAVVAYYAVFRKQREEEKRKEDALRLQVWNSVLDAVFPGARLNDDREKVDMGRIDSVLPANEHRLLNDCCALHDALDTHIYQVYAYDEYCDSEDRLQRETQFDGLVLHVRIPTGMSGGEILKVVRTNKVLGWESHRGGKTKGLERFETEDIVFNANYDAYCSPGSVAARAVLGPSAIVQLDRWVDRHPVHLTADAKNILIAFDLRGDLHGLFSGVQVSYGRILPSGNEYLEENFYEALRSALEEPMRFLSAVAEQIVKN